MAKLIAGLEALGCANTQGEGQTLCVISDSFNMNGYADSLQESGDLPEVETVLVCGQGLPRARRPERACDMTCNVWL